MLEVQNVCKSYLRGKQLVHAVKGVSINLNAGELVAIVGPSGCGKSSFLQLCGGMDRMDEGEVFLEEQALSILSDEQLTRVRRSRVGFIFQFFNLLPTLTVQQNIALPLLLCGESVSATDSKVFALAERVGLTERLNHFPQEISGGEAQRTAIARAIIHRPAVIVADEPTGNLDSDNGRKVLDLLVELNVTFNTAVLLATHDQQVADRAGRVVEMQDGRVIGR